jgi:hypothetical protein
MNQAIRVGTGLSAQDERAICAVLIAYATGIDQRDWLSTCFSHDALSTQYRLYFRDFRA